MPSQFVLPDMPKDRTLTVQDKAPIRSQTAGLAAPGGTCRLGRQVNAKALRQYQHGSDRARMLGGKPRLSIPAVSPPRHAWLQVVCGAKAPPFVATILTSLIRMHQHALIGLAPPHGHQQGIQGQPLGQRRLHRPADDLARVQIHHHCQVQPARPGPQIGVESSGGAVSASRRSVSSARSPNRTCALPRIRLSTRLCRCPHQQASVIHGEGIAVPR